MLKPLNPLKPVTKNLPAKSSEKPSEIIVSLVNGKQVYSNADTGEIINMDHARHTPAYEIFNPEKASIVISALAQGQNLGEAIELASISKATFSTWIMNHDEFNQAVDKARSVRAQHAHEAFYSAANEELTKDLPTDDEAIKLHLKRLSIIEKRQRILNIQKKEDNPLRFSDKESNQLQAAAVSISIDPDIINKMQAKFSSTLNSDGELDLTDSNKKLETILDADFKEVE